MKKIEKENKKRFKNFRYFHEQEAKKYINDIIKFIKTDCLHDNKVLVINSDFQVEERFGETECKSNEIPNSPIKDEDILVLAKSNVNEHIFLDICKECNKLYSKIPFHKCSTNRKMKCAIEDQILEGCAVSYMMRIQKTVGKLFP